MPESAAPLDIAIVGAGPAGLAAAWACKNEGLCYAVFDRCGIADSIGQYPLGMEFFSDGYNLELPGMTLANPNFAKPTRESYLAELTRYVRIHDLTVYAWQEVTNITGTDGDYTLSVRQTHGGVERPCRARKVILCTGSFDTHNSLGESNTIPGIQLAKVLTRYREPYPYSTNRVMVVGGRNSAVEAALQLMKAGAEVDLVHRGADISAIKAWLVPEMENRIKDGDIKAWFNSRVIAITEERVTLSTPKGETELPNDFVFLLIGNRPNKDFLTRIGVPLDEKGYPLHARGNWEVSGRPGMHVAGVLAGEDIFIEHSRIHGPDLVRQLTQCLKRN